VSGAGSEPPEHVSLTAEDPELSIRIPDTGLTEAKGTRPTQHGTVASSWTSDDSGTSLTTTIPVNTTAVVELPAGD
jgi:alpha-L-rhamnosidase